MKFRLKAFGIHLSSSVCVLSLVWGGLYLGWYYWPGFYLTGALKISGIMAAVDVVLGPLLTLVVANPGKSRRELTRDISIIVVVQMCALVYGSITLWNGRPLYYLYSEKWLQLVQASDITAQEAALARKDNPQFAPHWYSLPRWAWAPLPEDPQEANRIVRQAIRGGADVTQMPRLFRPYGQASTEMRSRLKAVDSLGEFSLQGKNNLKRRMTELGYAVEQPIGMVLMGSAGPLLAVMDPASLQIKALLRPD